MGTEELKRGRLITIEGGEGAGKSTQARLLVAALAKAGVAALCTREPGGAPAAEEIRRLLVQGEPGRWDAVTEALLMVAARRSHLMHTIQPALGRGEWVVCDRFVDSTTAYQGYGGGVPLAALAELHRLIAGDLMPDLTFILDVPVAKGLSRAAGRSGSETRFERMDAAFHERLRQGFLEIAHSAPGRCVIIDAQGDVDTVQGAMLEAVRGRLGIKV